MYLIIYVSTATKPLADWELQEILKKSRQRNEAHAITGLLLYKEGSFMQFLEGTREEVLFLLTKIRADPRHHGLMVVLQEEHSGREFAGWSMAYHKIDANGALEIPGYGDCLDLPLTSERFLMDPSKTLTLLLAFKKSIAANPSLAAAANG